MTENTPEYDPPRRTDRTHRHGDRHGQLVNAIFQNNWRGSVHPYIEFLGQSPGASHMLVEAAMQLIECIDDPLALSILSDAALRAERKARGTP